MKEIIIKTLLIIGLFILGVAIVGGWYFGIPYLYYIIFDNLDYSDCLAIWFGIMIIGHVIQRYKLNRQLRQYQQIADILKGKKHF